MCHCIQNLCLWKMNMFLGFDFIRQEILFIDKRNGGVGGV